MPVATSCSGEEWHLGRWKGLARGCFGWLDCVSTEESQTASSASDGSRVKTFRILFGLLYWDCCVR